MTQNTVWTIDYAAKYTYMVVRASKWIQLDYLDVKLFISI
jgi:hypothetical protein